ncbi:hypothetical protein FB451DRAFT_1407674 [Mycena latifolia]|nr:hypothetical protein FB451DRAFT_1407674 [Mycena latifolia]
MRMGSRADVEWVDPEGNINVFLKPLTTVFREMEGQIGDVDELKKLDSLARRCGLQMLKFDEEDTVCGFAERYLADVAVINQLINVKQTSALEALMSLWSDLRLYTVGMASPGHWKIVEKHFPSRREQLMFGWKTLNFQPGKKGWQQLPDEIRTRVFKHFDIRDITAMAETHPYYCSYFVDIMRNFFESSFEQWGLNWMTVKVMLYDTDNLISGPTANALMHPYRSVRDSSIIDFYVSSHTLFGMLGYFKVTTKYMPSATMKHPHHMISKTIVLKHKNSVKYPAEIQIHVSSRENPRASVIRQQLTGLFACAQGFPIHYPDLTLNGTLLLLV